MTEAQQTSSDNVRRFWMAAAIAVFLAAAFAWGFPDSYRAAATSQPSGPDGLPLHDEHEALQRSYGYSAAETAELLARQPSLMLVAGELGTRHSDVVAGSYIDHERRGVLVVRATGDQEQLRRHIAEEWPDLGPYIEVHHGHIPLDLQARITDQLLDAFERAGIDNVLTGMDHVENGYFVVVDPGDLASVEAIVRETAREHGVPDSAFHMRARAHGDDGIRRTLHSPCTSAPIRCNPPARGGLFLESPTGWCASGFMAENTAGSYYTMSAGH